MEKLLFNLRNKVVVDKENKIELGKNIKIRKCRIKIRGKNNLLKIEDGVNLSGVNIEIRGENGLVHIGKNTVIGENTYLSVKDRARKIVIGENCMFSRNINIMTFDGHDIYQNGQKINNSQDIEIGHKVWLADGVVLLKGSEISEGSVVGINSLVTKKFKEKNIILAGNPARKIKEDIEWKD